MDRVCQASLLMLCERWLPFNRGLERSLQRGRCMTSPGVQFRDLTVGDQANLRAEGTLFFSSSVNSIP